MNKAFQNALKRQPQAVPPIWFMRQAGRYHSHYQNLRRNHPFMDLCKRPELAAQVALGPVQDFDFDVAILFSDLLFPLEAMGMGLAYKEAGPELGWQLDEKNVAKLRSATEALAGLQFQKHAVAQTRKLLPANKSLIGFVGGPWTLFAYAAEGRHKGDLLQAKRALALYRPFCAKLIPLLEGNIQMQLEAGAEVVMLFDTAAGELSSGIFQEVVAPTLASLARKFPDQLGYYAKGITLSHLRDWSESLPWAGIGVDHRFDLAEVLALRSQGFCQGNFDQSLLLLKTADFERELDRYIKRIKKLSPVQRAGWVCGLGHGVLQHTPEAHVRQFIRTIRREF